MKIVQTLEVAAIAVGLTASAAAGWSGYSVAQHFNAPSQTGENSTIAVSVNGNGVGKQLKGTPGKDIVEPSAPHTSSPRWR